MPKRLGQALLIGCGLTGLGFVFFFAFPETNTYLAAPGVVVAFIVNGGVHGGGLGKLFGVAFFIIVGVVNVTLYSMLWLLIDVTIRVARKRSSSRELKSQEPKASS